MLLHIVFLIVSFGIILVGSELFTNGVEWAGERFGVAEAAVGSLLAAVGTALPETFVPAVAIIMSRGHPGPHSEVGVGAIVGAPLMLSTVALLVMGVAALAFRKRRRRVTLRVGRRDARRDIGFFLPVFLVLVILGAAFDMPVATRRMLAISLLIVYGIYAWRMLRLERSAEAVVEHGLYLELALRGDPENPRVLITIAQAVIGVGLILVGAVEFVDQIVVFSAHAGISPGVLSLILSPLATELPEKYNSVVWIRQRKDHLALANITGAMVFQSCIPVALGVAFTPWRLGPPELLGGSIALVSAAMLYLNVSDSELGTPTLMMGGVGYAIFIGGLAWLGAL